ncbi:MAG: bifunctional 5,10-methylenetetrahydrofolate dehydrogenase/5,10-methenyltetrahydrofolate cyclohydrolase [Candidatus Micrarchaeota archaeon]|nr:bifunctional 5,10-methylenetetrahydrofolate dehydrogenase/5,10-methenyltetrahydrofolate cyclohydrolase [Candidatus Micrarchaeota archaeon]
MAAVVVDGNKLAQEVLSEISAKLEGASPKPTLAFVLVGKNHASEIYAKKKAEDCRKVGINSLLVRLPASFTQAQIINKIRELNADQNVDGIIVQLPLPPKIDENKIIEEISPHKDVDGFHPYNFGNTALGVGKIAPCTAAGVVYLLKKSGIKLEGKHAVVVGRSRIVGKPLSLMLLNENCTVTVCHSKTKGLPKYTRQADIVCMAVGKPRMLKASMIKKGAIVIDIGINREGEKLVGDVDFGPVSRKASLITPVPGGVGPMTRAMLIKNTFECYRMRRMENDSKKLS